MTYCWSRDCSVFAGYEFDTIEEAMNDATANGCNQPYIASIERQDVASLASAYDVIEGINNHDDMIDADVLLEPTKEQADELTESLRKIVGEWLSKHGLTQQVESIERMSRYGLWGNQIVELKGGE